MIKKIQILCLLLFSVLSIGQTFPVGITVQVTPPAPIYLSQYADLTTLNSPVSVQVLLNDLTITNREVRLKCYWQGNGVSFVNNDFVIGAQPIYLSGGTPVLLTKNELAPYFEFQNLQGITPNSYAEALPEGSYNVCFEVYDQITGKKLSKKSCTTTIIFQNEPPFLNLPLNNAAIPQQNIQNIPFSWTPRHINVSNVEYEFKLVEIWDNFTPVQNAYFNSPALYTTTTQSTTLLYGIAEPQLIPGKKYAWGVRAKALKNAEEIGVFKNNGYSEIFAFTYEVNCSPPVAISTTNVGKTEAKIEWSGDVANFDYQVKYREKNANSNWYTLVTAREYINITNLKPNTAYEYSVGASCELNKYTHSILSEFTTLAESEPTFAGCNLLPDPIDITNKNPLPQLLKNDIVKAGDYPIVVTSVTGSNGVFSGEGYVTFPFLAKVKKLIDAANNSTNGNAEKFTRIKVDFSNIGVNTDFKLISGAIVATYDANWTAIIDTDTLEQLVTGTNGNVSTITVNFPITTIVNNGNGTVTITGTNGQTSVVTVSSGSMVITDSNGTPWTVPVNGQPVKGDAAPGGVPTPANTAGMGSGGAVTQISSKDVTVVFEPSGFYSFDAYPASSNNALLSTYESIPTANGGKYKVHYKAISNNAAQATDEVTATVTLANGKKTSDIVFKTPDGLNIPAIWSGNKVTLTLKKNFDYAKDAVLATVKPADSTKKYEIAGKLNLYHLQEKKVNVTLVGLNGATVPSDAAAALNAIYNKAGIAFEVNTLNTTIPNTWGTSIETGDSDLLNTYTTEQQKINADFKTTLGTNYKTDTYYVFFVGTPASNGAAGFMPLKKQFGFVFSGGIKTLAHELGHGVFGLQHPFKQYNTPKGSTTLLMDYGTSTDLSHNDWEVMHAPGLQLYQFTQGDSEGEYKGDVYYYNPSGYPFYLNNRGTTNEFCLKERTIIELIPNLDITNGTKANGVIWAWKEIDCNNVTKTYKAKVENKKFYGYFLDDEQGRPTQNSYPVYWEGIFNQDSFKNTDFNKVYILEYNGKCKYSFYTSHYISKEDAPLEDDYKNGIPIINNLSNYRDKVFERSGDLKNCTPEQAVELKIYSGEYVNYETYKKIYGSDAFELSNNDWHGAWLLSDRKEKNARWKNAMETITRNKWTNVLKPFAQIRDYYLWVQYYANLKGYKSRWAKGASYLVDELADAYEEGLTPANQINWSDNLGSHILQDLNLGIANFAIGQFNKLFFGSDISRAKNDSDAYLWDKDFIEKEQVTVVAFDVYSKYEGTNMLNDLNKMTRKESVGNLGANPSRFIPDFSKVGVNVNDASTQFGASGRFNIPLFMIWTFNHTFDKNIGNAKIGFQKYLLSNDKLNPNYVKKDLVYSTGPAGGSADYKDDFVDQIKKANQLIEEFCNEYKIK
jgi:hypothetical protein